MTRDDEHRITPTFVTTPGELDVEEGLRRLREALIRLDSDPGEAERINDIIRTTDTAGRRYELGCLAVDQGDLEAAVNHFRHAAEAHHPEAAHQLALILRRLAGEPGIDDLRAREAIAEADTRLEQAIATGAVDPSDLEAVSLAEETTQDDTRHSRAAAYVDGWSRSPARYGYFSGSGQKAGPFEAARMAITARFEALAREVVKAAFLDETFAAGSKAHRTVVDALSGLIEECLLEGSYRRSTRLDPDLDVDVLELLAEGSTERQFLSRAKHIRDWVAHRTSVLRDAHRPITASAKRSDATVTLLELWLVLVSSETGPPDWLASRPVQRSASVTKPDVGAEVADIVSTTNDCQLVVMQIKNHSHRALSDFWVTMKRRTETAPKRPPATPRFTGQLWVFCSDPNSDETAAFVLPGSTREEWTKKPISVMRIPAGLPG